MKKLLILFFLFITTPSFAQCVSEIKSVTPDDRGKIKVCADFALNGDFVQNGCLRYDENSASTLLELREKIASDAREHCKKIIERIPENQAFIFSKIAERQEELVSSAIANLESDVGATINVSESSITYKGKEIKVTYDSNNTYTDTP